MIAANTGLPPAAARLMPIFDHQQLVRELGAVTAHRWKPQRIHAPGGNVGPATETDWRVLPLRSPGGDPNRTDPGGPGPLDFAATPWLEHLPYLRRILTKIPAPLNAVRLMALGPGAACQPHRDSKYRLDRGLVRLHLPITTNPGAVIALDDTEHCWATGTLWYGDFSREHHVRNDGHGVRVHVVIDALLTRALTCWFPKSWQASFGGSDVLLNHPVPLPTPLPTDVPTSVEIPCGFTDFSHDAALDGPSHVVRLGTHGSDLTLATEDRTFALVPAAPGIYRFAGWSEQRTLHFTDDGIVLRLRLGRGYAERPVAAVTVAP